MVTPHLPFWEDRRRDETEKGATDANWPKTKVRMQKGAEASWFFRHFGQLAFLFRSSRVERGIRCIQYYETPPFFFFFTAGSTASSKSCPQAYASNNTCDRRLVTNREYLCPWVVVMIFVSFRMSLRLHRPPAGTKSPYPHTREHNRTHTTEYNRSSGKGSL